jgi:MFS family permease
LDPHSRTALRRNGAFVRVWTAATVSVFGSFVTRMALPFVAILTLKAGPIDVAILRGLELVAALLVGFVAGAWVDRLRRRPVMIWADLGRAVLLGSIPAAAVLGVLGLPQVFAVAAAGAVLTTFFDTADRAYLPTIVDRGDIVRANASLTATSSAVEFAGFGIAGVLVNLFTAPIAILIDAASFVVSAVLIGSIRQPEPPPPPAAEREPVFTEIIEGLRVVAHDPVLRALVGGSMGLAAMWGISGATWLLFATETLSLDPALIGVIAALGGFGSLFGSVVAERVVATWGFGHVAIISLLVAAFAIALTPLAPAGLPVVAVALLLAQQLIGDGAMTVFYVGEVSVRQARVADRQLGRVTATARVASVAAQLVATVLGGLAAEAIGLRGALILAPVCILLGAAAIAFSPVRSLRLATDR